MLTPEEETSVRAILANFTPELAALSAQIVNRMKLSYQVDLAKAAQAKSQQTQAEAVAAAEAALAQADAAIAAIVGK